MIIRSIYLVLVFKCEFLFVSSAGVKGFSLVIPHRPPLKKRGLEEAGTSGKGGNVEECFS